MWKYYLTRHYSLLVQSIIVSGSLNLDITLRGTPDGVVIVIREPSPQYDRLDENGVNDAKNILSSICRKRNVSPTHYLS